MKRVNLYGLWFTIFISISLLGNKKTDLNNGCEQKITFDVIIFTNRLSVHETNNEHNHTENSQRFMTSTTCFHRKFKHKSRPKIIYLFDFPSDGNHSSQSVSA